MPDLDENTIKGGLWIGNKGKKTSLQEWLPVHCPLFWLVGGFGLGKLHNVGQKYAFGSQATSSEKVGQKGQER